MFEDNKIIYSKTKKNNVLQRINKPHTNPSDTSGQLTSGHVLLCGFMGAGKSSIGRTLAKTFNVPFHDLDKVIEEKEAMIISNIFSKHGESYFRELERRYLEELLLLPNSVIALGGGTLQSQEIVDHIKANNLLVYLDIPFSLIVRRIKNSKTRPMLFNEDGSKRDIEQLKAYLYALHKKREILYLQADYHLRIDPEWNRDFTVEKIAKYIKKHTG